jgi:hypothetical protein
MLINELHRYLKVIPKIIVTTSKKFGYEAINMGLDYILKPLAYRFYKVNLKVEKSSLTVQLF